MRYLIELLRANAALWWGKYICAEDPEARLDRMMLESMREIERKSRETEALRDAMGAWAPEIENAEKKAA